MPRARSCGHAARSHGLRADAPAGAAGRGRARERDRQALQHRRHELRLHLQGSARVPGNRHEPPWWAQQHRRGRRGPGARDAAGKRRQQVQRHQAGGVGPFRRDQPLPVERHRDSDQDGPGRKTRRRRPPARQEGVPVDRRGSPLHAGRGPDFPAAASRHLLHRGPGGAHLRLEKCQPRCARFGEAVRAGGRGHHRHRRGEGRCGQDHHLRPQRRHGRGPARLHLPCGHPVRDRPGGNPADASAQRPA